MNNQSVNSNQEQFWKIRSEKYDNLKWVHEQAYIKAFKSSGDFRKNDLVLDVGTGTGVIAHAIAPLVKEVIGLDLSQDMLDHSNWKDNKYFIKRDIRDSIFYDKVFDKVTARMVFHHITEETQEAIRSLEQIKQENNESIMATIPLNENIKFIQSEAFR